MRWWIWVLLAVGLGLALLFALAMGDPEERGAVGNALADLLASITGRGPKRGPSTTPDGLGVIREDPQGLANSAALDLDVYALARMLSSEEGNAPTLYKVAVGFAARNAAHGRIAEKLLAGKGDAFGFFGRQSARYLTGRWLDAEGDVVDGTTPGAVPEDAHAGKYASTALDPHEDDVSIATSILSGLLADPTGGATNFFSPRLQDARYETGRADRNAADVDAKWRAGGLEPVTVDGVDAFELAFYKPVQGGPAHG